MNDPLIVTWTVQAGLPELPADLAAALAPLLGPDASLTDEVVSLEDGAEVHRGREFRFSQFFDRWGMLPPTGRDPDSIRLFFRRRPEAGRFWKDMMASVLRKARQVDPTISIALDYSVVDESACLAAGRVPAWIGRLGAESQNFWSIAASYLLDHRSFRFSELEASSGIPAETLGAWHRNSHRAIHRAEAPNPLWSRRDSPLENHH